MVSTSASLPHHLHPAFTYPQAMAGFGSSSGAFLGGNQAAPRLQYYSTPPSQSSNMGQSKPIPGRRFGKVKFFDTQKGYGFINDYSPEDIGNEEVFVHYTAITAKAGFKSLAEGEEAEYDIVRGPKGFQAANVTGPGGAQVMGDNRSRVNKNAFLTMSPYAAMFPYIQQDPAAFYATSPYNQPLMLLPQTEYRNPASQTAASYRHVPPLPTFPANPSPYSSPGPIRPYDIGKDFAGVNLAALSVDDGVRGNRAAGGGTAPFGGMFGTVPGYAAPPASTSAQTSHTAFPSSSSVPSAPLHNATGPPVAASGTKTYKPFAASAAARSGSLDGVDRATAPGHREPASPASVRTTDASAAAAGRPPAAQHSRSSSLLYSSRPAGSPTP